MANKKIKNYCSDCGQATNHDVLSEYTELHREDYACDISFQIVSCCGCETKSFRKVFEDIEAAYPEYDEDGEEVWIVPKEIDVYPKSIKGHKSLDHPYYLPEIVKIIYSETIRALKEDAKVLAGLGLRASVEAVCNDLNIEGRTLEVRINKLSTGGYISKKDIERLHAIRFMGNDAAHEIKKPKKESLAVALQIVEHLILSVYILEKESEGNLETTTSDYSVFWELLESSSRHFQAGEEIPLAKFLGKNIRRVKDSIPNLENELINKINNNEYPKLSIGKVDHYLNSKDKLQHFILKNN